MSSDATFPFRDFYLFGTVPYWDNQHDNRIFAQQDNRIFAHKNSGPRINIYVHMIHLKLCDNWKKRWGRTSNLFTEDESLEAYEKRMAVQRFDL